MREFKNLNIVMNLVNQFVWLVCITKKVVNETAYPKTYLTQVAIDLFSHTSWKHVWRWKGENSAHCTGTAGLSVNIIKVLLQTTIYRYCKTGILLGQYSKIIFRHRNHNRTFLVKMVHVLLINLLSYIKIKITELEDVSWRTITWIECSFSE